MLRACVIAFSVLLGGSLICRGADDARIPIPPATEILASLHKSHPRLLASAQDFTRLKQRVASTEQLKRWHAKLQEQAQRILTDPPSRYEIPDGLRLLGVSRRVFYRTQTLALLCQLGGDGRYADRVWKELEAAANFPDWNPRHFLDTSEMAHAFAIGYDWLYDLWTPEQRAVLRTAMVEKGLKPALEIHRKQSGWTRARHNWNQVCNGGIGMSALALADVESELAGEFLHDALESIQLPMAEYGPDGAWAEGPGYWNYATSYNVVFLAALQSALGVDFGLVNIPGFSQTGMFPIYVTGPLGHTFNYADGGDAVIRSPSLFWLGKQFRIPAYMEYQTQYASPHPLDMLWFEPQTGRASSKALPLDKYFRTAEVATFRSEWDDRDAVFVGFKAGDNKANHSHLDLGSFVFDALGVRWAVDLGAGDYNLPGYFGGNRWNYYRLRAEGHNTLLINPAAGPDQDPKAPAKIINFQTKANRAFAVADLSPAYASQRSNVQRGIALIERKRVLVQDEVNANQPVEVWWFLHTPAEVSVNADGTTATLAQSKARLAAQILAPANAAFVVMNAAPLSTSPHPEKQATNEGLRKVAIHLKDVKDLRLAVLLTPLSEDEAVPKSELKVTALRNW